MDHVHQGCIKFRTKELSLFQYMNVILNWIGYTPQEAELKWQEEEFTDLPFKEI